MVAAPTSVDPLSPDGSKHLAAISEPGASGRSTEHENETAVYAAGSVRGWVYALLKKSSATGTAKVLTKTIVKQTTASSVYYRALKRARPNAFIDGRQQHNTVTALGSPRRLWVRLMLSRAFLLTAHTSSGVALFGGYYWALRILHFGDHRAATNWHNPNPMSAVVAGAAGGAMHALIVQPLLLYQNNELSLGRLTQAELAWEHILESRGLQRQGHFHYQRQRVLRWTRRLNYRLPSAVGRDAVCFGTFFGTFAVVKNLCAPWLLQGSEDERDARLVAQATFCGGLAGLGGHVVHGLVGRSFLRKPEYRHSAFKVPPIRELIGGAPRATLAAAAGFGAAEAALLMAEHWVHGKTLLQADHFAEFVRSSIGRVR